MLATRVALPLWATVRCCVRLVCTMSGGNIRWEAKVQQLLREQEDRCACVWQLQAAADLCRAGRRRLLVMEIEEKLSERDQLVGSVLLP